MTRVLATVEKPFFTAEMRRFAKTEPAEGVIAVDPRTGGLIFF